MQTSDLTFCSILEYSYYWGEGLKASHLTFSGQRSTFQQPQREPHNPHGGASSVCRVHVSHRSRLPLSPLFLSRAPRSVSRVQESMVKQAGRAPAFRKLDINGGDRDETDPSRTEQGELSLGEARGLGRWQQVMAAGPEGAACFTDIATVHISLGLGCGSPTPLFWPQDRRPRACVPWSPGPCGPEGAGFWAWWGRPGHPYSEPQPLWPSFTPLCSLVPPA